MGTADARLWIFWLLDTLNQPDLARVLVMLWAIWWARRKAIHDNEFQSPMSTLCFVNKYLEELDSAAVRCPVPSRSGVVQQREKKRWIPPPDGYCKIHVDGGLSRHGDRGLSVGLLSKNMETGELLR